MQLAGMTIFSEGRYLGGAIIALDLRALKDLEREKLTAERLAAVGQTVAGLAHGIKNVLMGLEGGMYAFQSGMTKGDDERMLQGWQMLEENINRITTFVKEFLEFARGRTPTVHLIDPNEVAAKVVDLFKDKAEMAGIRLSFEPQAEVPPAFMDEEGIHSLPRQPGLERPRRLRDQRQAGPGGHAQHPRPRGGPGPRGCGQRDRDRLRDPQEGLHDVLQHQGLGQGNRARPAHDPEDRPAARRQGVVRVDAGRRLGLPAGVPPRPAAPPPRGGRRPLTDRRRGWHGLRTRPFWSSTTSPTSATT